MMTWTALVGVTLLVALAVVTAVGAMLPREHRTRRMAEYHREPGEVWNAITEFSALPAWMPGVKSATALEPDDGLPRWMLQTAEGPMVIEVVEITPPSRMVGRIGGDKLSFGGTWTYEVAPVPGGARLTITEDGWISNPLFRFFARYVFGLNRTVDDALRGLGTHLGETVRPRAAAGG